MPARAPASFFEVCILAGGLSTRMGREKSRIRIRGVTMLAIIRRTAATALHLRARVIRQDRVQRCGPLGGIVTALQTSKARALLFLACDMPLVSTALLQRLVRASRKGERAVFVTQRRRVGFPCLLPIEALAVAERQIVGRDFSLQKLARKLRAHRLPVSIRSHELFNVNTPADAAEARRLAR